MDVDDETMSLFKENKSYCSCAWLNEKELTCNCGEPEPEPIWKWDENAKTPATILSNNCQQVYFHKGYSVGNACVRGDTPMVYGNDYYWEIKMISSVYGTSMMVGIGTESFDINQTNEEFCNLLGLDGESWGLKFDGRLYHNNKSQDYHSLAGFTIGSIIGIHLDMWNGKLEFYLNRIPLGVAFTGLKNKILYPMVSSTAAHSIMKLIFAHSEPYSLSLLSAKLLELPTLRKLPPGLKSYCNTSWWLLPKSNRLITDICVKTLNSPSQCKGVYLLIDSDEEEDDENPSENNVLTNRMKSVLENSRQWNSTFGQRSPPLRWPNCQVRLVNPVRVNRGRPKPWTDY